MELSPCRWVVFDIGNVFVRWDPENLYRKIFKDPFQRQHFLTQVCPFSWHEEQDAGRKLSEGLSLAINQHPHFEAEIRAYYERWDEMFDGVIHGTVDILNELSEQGVPCLGLTNWSAELFPRALEQFPFLKRLDGVVVSGAEGVRKPHPEIFHRLTARFGLHPGQTFFTDDRADNCQTAKDLGWVVHQFGRPEVLRSELKAKGFKIS